MLPTFVMAEEIAALPDELIAQLPDAVLSQVHVTDYALSGFSKASSWNHTIAEDVDSIYGTSYSNSYNVLVAGRSISIDAGSSTNGFHTIANLPYETLAPNNGTGFHVYKIADDVVLFGDGFVNSRIKIGSAVGLTDNKTFFTTALKKKEVDIYLSVKTVNTPAGVAKDTTAASLTAYIDRMFVVTNCEVAAWSEVPGSCTSNASFRGSCTTCGAVLIEEIPDSKGLHTCEGYVWGETGYSAVCLDCGELRTPDGALIEDKLPNELVEAGVGLEHVIDIPYASTNPSLTDTTWIGGSNFSVNKDPTAVGGAAVTNKWPINAALSLIVKISGGNEVGRVTNTDIAGKADGNYHAYQLSEGFVFPSGKNLEIAVGNYGTLYVTGAKAVLAGKTADLWISLKVDAAGYPTYDRLIAVEACADENCGCLPAIAEASHVHNYEAVMTAPTCEADGFTTYTCACGDAFTADEEAALGHTFGEYELINGWLVAECINGCGTTDHQESNIYDSGYCGANLTWELTYDGVLTISGTGPMEDFIYESESDWGNEELPWDDWSLRSVNDGEDSYGSEDGYYEYTSAPWFDYRSSVNTLVIEEGVTTIGDYAFYNSESLTEVTIPDSVTVINSNAFRYCFALEEVTLGDGVTVLGQHSFAANDCLREVNFGTGLITIDEYAFTGCDGLTDLTIPQGVKTIGNYAFSNCNVLVEVTIPDSVTTIGNCAFRTCPELTAVYFEGNAPAVTAASAAEPTFIADNVTLYYIPGTTGWTDSSAYDAESATWNGYKLAIWIGSAIASGYCGREGDGTNLIWKLTEDGTLTISGTGAMADYTYESDYDWGDGEGGAPDEDIIDWSLRDTDSDETDVILCSEDYGDGYYEYATTPWYEYRSAVNSIVIEEGVTTLGDYAFYNCDSLTAVSIPDNVEIIGECAFEFCFALEEVVIGNGVTAIGEYAFAGNDSLTELTLGANLITIGDYAFSGCDGLTAVTLPENVKTIGIYAFNSCNMLTEIVIPANVETIGGYAFRTCPELTAVYFEGNAPAVTAASAAEPTFIADNVTLYYIPGTTGWTNTGTWNGYDLAVWEERAPSYTVTFNSNGGSSVAAQTVGYGETATEPSDPYRYQYIFLGWYSDEALTTEYDFSAVVDADVTLYAKWMVDNIYDSGYCGANLTWELTYDGVLTISGTGPMEDFIYESESDWGNEELPWDDWSLRSVNDGEDSYGSEDGYYEYTSAPWFDYRSSVNTLVIEEGVTTIGDYAFYNSESLTEVTIPDSVTVINSNAFRYCFALEEVTLGDGVTVLGQHSFAANDCLREVNFGTGLITIDEYAFTGCDGLTDLTIPQGVKTIGNYAFSNCNVLVEVTIPDSVTTIGNCAFRTCPELTAVYFEGNAPAVTAASAAEPTFIADNVTLYYAPGTTGWMDSEAYDAETGTWNGYKLEIWPGKAIPGDINNDGETNLKDLTRLFQYLADWEVEVNEAVLDVNGDGSINLKDQTRLFQYLADWDVEIYPVV